MRREGREARSVVVLVFWAVRGAFISCDQGAHAFAYSAKISVLGLRVSNMLEMRLLVNTLGFTSR